jgi:hypothetical protein
MEMRFISPTSGGGILFDSTLKCSTTRQHLLKTLCNGKRKQHRLEVDVFVYTKRFNDLKRGMSHVVVIVKSGFKSKGAVGIPNNFVLTAYQKKIFHKP